MSAAAAVAINLIRKRGSMRTPALAEELGIGEAAVDAMLEPARTRGELTTCDVETGGRRIIEYRCSASGGKYDLLTARATLRAKPPQHIEPTAAQVPAKATSGCDAEADSRKVEPATSARAAPASAVATHRETTAVAKTFKEKVTEIFTKHGPLTSRELKKHHGISDASRMLNLIASNGEFAKLGGTPKNTIFGLPDQQLSDRKVDAKAPAADKPPRAIHRKKPAKHARKRAGGGSVAMRRKPHLKRSKKAFRPALAADGAILFLGAHRGDFEIPRAEARVVVDLVRRLSGDELVQAVEFIERLDNAEVGA